MVRRCSVNYCMGDLQSTIILGPGTRSSTLGRLWFCMDRARRNYAHGPLPIIMQCPSRCCWRAGRTGGLAGWLGGTVVGWLALSWLAATTGGRVELTLRRLILYQSRIVRVSLWGVHGSTQQQPRPEPEIRRLAGSSLSCLRAGETVGQHGRDDAQRSRSRSRSRSRLGGTSYAFAARSVCSSDCWTCYSPRAAAYRPTPSLALALAFALKGEIHEDDDNDDDYCFVARNRRSFSYTHQTTS